jgi:AraC family transcriptional regulator
MDGASQGRDSGITSSKKSIRIEFERLSANGMRIHGPGDSRRPGTERAFRVILASGRGCMLHGCRPPPTVLLPLRGSVRLAAGESSRTLLPGQLYFAEEGKDLQAVGNARALWIAFAAQPAVWRHLLDANGDTPSPAPVFLPGAHTIDRATRRSALHLAREARNCSGTTIEGKASVLRLVGLLADLQSSFDRLIKKCPGRTRAQRRGVFLRLKRAHNCMETNYGMNLGVTGLAHVANYSSCHFVRTFSAVYGQTPYAMLIERRLMRAFHLVYDSELSITEVARVSGFEDRCAFARSFKQRFGATASAVRDGVQPISSAANLVLQI